MMCGSITLCGINIGLIRCLMPVAFPSSEVFSAIMYLLLLIYFFIASLFSLLSSFSMCSCFFFFFLLFCLLKWVLWQRFIQFILYHGMDWLLVYVMRLERLSILTLLIVIKYIHRMHGSVRFGIAWTSCLIFQ